MPKMCLLGVPPTLIYEMDDLHGVQKLILSNQPLELHVYNSINSKTQANQGQERTGFGCASHLIPPIFMISSTEFCISIPS
jgi:hypothetical protein